MKDVRLAIATPSIGVIKTKTVESLIKLFKAYPDAVFLSHEGSIIHYMRERLVKKAIDLGCTHLLFVDSDMVFEKDAVAGLIARNKDIVGADYNRRKLPLEGTAIFPKIGKQMAKRDEVVKVIQADSVGTGFMLIKLSIFDFLPEPWFFWESNRDGELVTGEDYWFCQLARKHNFEVWCDLGLRVGHLGDWIF